MLENKNSDNNQKSFYETPKVQVRLFSPARVLCQSDRVPTTISITSYDADIELDW